MAIQIADYKDAVNDLILFQLQNTELLELKQTPKNHLMDYHVSLGSIYDHSTICGRMRDS